MIKNLVSSVIAWGFCKILIPIAGYIIDYIRLKKKEKNNGNIS